MKRLFRYKYPKLTLLALMVVLAYVLFNSAFVIQTLDLSNVSYITVFLAGMLFSFGFTTPLAVGFFLTAVPDNIFLAAIIGGIGACLSDITIFKLIKVSFMDEFKRLEHTKPIKEMRILFHTKLRHKVQNYLLYFCAGFIIASPLPDELGVSMLAGLTHIRTFTFTLISFLCNTVGILIMLIIL